MAKIFKATKPTGSIGKQIKVNVSKLDINGIGVGRVESGFDKKPIFIEGALPNEQVLAVVSEQKSKYLKAKLRSLETTSEYRVSPKCQHFKVCGGCDLQHLAYQEQLTFKQQKVSDLFARQGVNGLPWQTELTAEPWHYRRKARIGVQYNKKGEAIIGFRQRTTNSLTPIKSCPVLVESLDNVFIQLEQVINQLPVKSIGHIEVIATDKIAIVVRQLGKLRDTESDIWQSAESDFNWQVYFDLGDEIKPLADYQPLNYQLTSACKKEKANEITTTKLTFKPEHFIQVNHQVNQKMVNQAVDWLAPEPNDNLLDLFCGLGNFSLAFARLVNKVVGVEGVGAMVEQATDNANSNACDNAEFYTLDLNSSWQKQAWLKSAFNKVILDPARAGALEACQQLVKLKPTEILYVSCDPSTLARDAKVLVDAGYQVKKISIIDMFCHTKHVETMVLFSKI